MRLRKIAFNITILCGSLFLCFLVIEICYRVFDPFPYFTSEEINQTELGNLSEYDQILGWRGVPEGRSILVTKNNRFSVAHNRLGFRDIEHDDSDKRPAIVFLGDSFTWGYEAESKDMFVNRLRDSLPDYNIFNFSHRGYGTDQELLTFKNWRDNVNLQWVILMFCENDVADNNSTFRNDKPKPTYQLVNNELALSGIPVPKHSDWAASPGTEKKPVPLMNKVRDFLLRSHFIHDVYFRYSLLRWPETGKKILKFWEEDAKKADLTLTSRILLELKKEVEMRNARLAIFFIPSKIEIEQLHKSPPYQIAIVELCQKLGIKCIDLAPYFKKTMYRTYYRQGLHWNSRGHQIAANAIYDYLSRGMSLEGN